MYLVKLKRTTLSKCFIRPQLTKCFSMGFKRKCVLSILKNNKRKQRIYMASKGNCSNLPPALQ